MRFQSFLDGLGLTAEQFAQENLNTFLSFEPINASLEIDGTSAPIDTTADSPYLNASYIPGFPMPAESAIRQFLYAPTTTVPNPIAYFFIANIGALIKPLPAANIRSKLAFSIASAVIPIQNSPRWTGTLP